MFRMPGVFGRWRLKREAEVWGCGFNVEQGNAEGRIVKKVMRPPQRRCVVGHVMDAHRLSRSCCCSLAELSRSMAYYVSTRPYDQRLRDRLRELARFHRRFGYLRLHYLLRREGLVVIPKRTYRLYREERLQVYKRKARKRFKGERVPLKPADGLKQIWLLDFIMGQSVHVASLQNP